jgi:hypothetical protein
MAPESRRMTTSKPGWRSAVGIRESGGQRAPIRHRRIGRLRERPALGGVGNPDLRDGQLLPETHEEHSSTLALGVLAPDVVVGGGARPQNRKNACLASEARYVLARCVHDAPPVREARRGRAGRMEPSARIETIGSRGFDDGIGPAPRRTPARCPDGTARRAIPRPDGRGVRDGAAAPVPPCAAAGARRSAPAGWQGRRRRSTARGGRG